MNTLIDVKAAFDKTQHAFLIKSPGNLGIHGQISKLNSRCIATIY